MGNAEVQSAATREHFVPDSLRERIGIWLLRGERLGEGDADLHRAAGADRVAVGEERLSERHAPDEVLVDLAQLPLGPRRGDTFGVTVAVGRLERERRVQRELRNARALAALLDLLLRNGAEARHCGIGLQARFLR